MTRDKLNKGNHLECSINKTDSVLDYIIKSKKEASYRLEKSKENTFNREGDEYIKISFYGANIEVNPNRFLEFLEEESVIVKKDLDKLKEEFNKL